LVLEGIFNFYLRVFIVIRLTNTTFWIMWLIMSLICTTTGVISYLLVIIIGNSCRAILHFHSLFFGLSGITIFGIAKYIYVILTSGKVRYFQTIIIVLNISDWLILKGLRWILIELHSDLLV